MIGAHSNALNWLSEAEKPHRLIVDPALSGRVIEWCCNHKHAWGKSSTAHGATRGRGRQFVKNLSKIL